MISDFTRRICAQLCIDKALQMEVDRLNDKAALMRARGYKSWSKEATEAETIEDNRRRAEAKKLADDASRTLEETPPEQPAALVAQQSDLFG
jgi:hypothetical protein